jgi:dipeptidase
MIDIYEWDTGKYLGKIKQVKQTFSVVGNMNEYQVVIGETTFGGREELVDTTAIMDYGSLIYITLQRAKTAREAIKIMTELVAEYGYYSSGESFSIADPNEVWILEMVGKGSPKKMLKENLLAIKVRYG